MKPLFSLLFLLHFTVQSYCQATFNLRERYDFLACTLTGIVPTDSCYYATGIIADTIFPYRTGNIFLKLGLDGEPIFIKTVKSTDRTYETWENTLHPTEDGGFLVTGYTFDPDMKALLIKYGPQGDTVFTKSYLNPAYPAATFIRPMDFAILNDEELFILSWLGTTVVGNSQFSVIKTDGAGELQFHKIYGDVYRDIPYSMKVSDNGRIVVGGKKGNENFVAENYVFRVYLLEIDDEGSEQWSYLSPLSWGLRDAANDLLLLPDGSIIVASGVGHEQQRASVNEVYFERHVFKLNPQRELEWELTFKDPTLTWAAETTNLVQLSDGSGYILAGRYFNPPASPPYNEPIKGWLAKISPQGDSVWTRTYAYLPNYPLVHTIYDMKETPDGGLIICGQSQDWSEGATYPQQGWLLKLDEHGCLVPGCHLVDAVEQVRREIGLAIYPNPTSGYLNFQLRAPAGSVQRGGQFRIISSGGAVMATFGSEAPGTTYIVPVRDWAAGVYYVQYLEGGSVRAVEGFVKQ